jgi:hypothetical protein
VTVQYAGLADNKLWVTLVNVGRGPALDVRVNAAYTHRRR